MWEREGLIEFLIAENRPWLVRLFIPDCSTVTEESINSALEEKFGTPYGQFFVNHCWYKDGEYDISAIRERKYDE